MRTEAENTKIHELAVALLKKRGIAAEQATYDQYAEAAEIAAECVAKDGENATTAQMLGRASLIGAESDGRMVGTLARFGTDGKFIADLSLTEQELLEAAITAQEQKSAEVIAAEAEARCPDCRKDWLACKC